MTGPRRRWARAAAVAVSALLAGCTSADNGGVVGTPVQPHGPPAPASALHHLVPAAIAATGVLRVGSYVDRPALLFYGTGTRQPQGAEYDLLQSIGRQLGLSIRIVDEPLGSLGPQLLAGKIDALMSGFADLKIFEGAGIDFVDYLVGRTSVLVRQGNPDHVRGPDDLCGRTVAVLGGTAQQVAAVSLDKSCTSRHRPVMTLRTLASHDQLVAEVAGGQVAAALDDAVVAAYTAQVSAGSGAVSVVGAAVAPVDYGIGVNRSDPQLRDAIAAALRAVIADGEYDQDLGRWGGELAALRTVPINAGR